MVDKFFLNTNYYQFHKLGANRDLCLIFKIPATFSEFLLKTISLFESNNMQISTFRCSDYKRKVFAVK